MASNTEVMKRGNLEYIDKTEGETLDNKTLNKWLGDLCFYKHHLTMKECKLEDGYTLYFQGLKKYTKINKIYQHQ